MRLIDSDALMEDINGSINEMTNVGIMVDGDWLWAKLNDALDNAPVVEERKVGKWIRGKCDQCGAHAPFWPMASTSYESDFCPNCGADMMGEQDE